MKAWLKGGIIILVIILVLSLGSVFFELIIGGKLSQGGLATIMISLLMSPFHFIFDFFYWKLSHDLKLIDWKIAYFITFSLILIIYFIVGTIIGLVIGKIKSKKEEK